MHGERVYVTFRRPAMWKIPTGTWPRQTLALRPPKLSGRDAEHPTKMPRQMALIGKAHRVGDLRQCEMGVSQHVARAFAPLLDEIVGRGNAGGLLEASREMMDRYSRDRGQRGQIDGVAQIRLDI